MGTIFGRDSLLSEQTSSIIEQIFWLPRRGLKQ